MSDQSFLSIKIVGLPSQMLEFVMPLLRVSLVCALIVLSFATGCGVQQSFSAFDVATGPASTMTGRVIGGQQPVQGATLQLYTVGTNGDGSPARALLTTAVMTDSNGNFSLSPNNVPLYSCSGATEVYLVATGGNPGTGSINPNIGLMAALGPCTSLTTSTFTELNEVTTVAAVEALAPFMSSATAIGSGPSDTAALDNAFSLASEFASSTTGSSPGANVPAGYSVPASLINTLADVIASCVNSVGFTRTGSTPCNDLFTAANIFYPAGLTATTIDALLYLARNPATDTIGLYSLIPAAPPFPASPVTPLNFSIALTATSGPAAGLQVSSLSFPATTEFSGLATLYLNLRNTGSTPVLLSAINVIGINAADFIAGLNLPNSTNENECTLVELQTGIPAGQSCTEEVYFTPLGVGQRQAFIEIVSNAPASPQYVSVTGTGISNGTGAANVFLPSASSSTGEILTVPSSATQLATPSSIYSSASQSSFGLQADKIGNIYAFSPNYTANFTSVDVFTNNAGVLSLSRSFTTSLSGINNIAADSTGRIFALYNSSNVNKVAVFAANASGSASPSFSISGYGNQYVAVDQSDNLYTFDASNNLAEFAAGFTASSSPTRTINLSSYYGTCPMAQPYGMATDTAGNVYILIAGLAGAGPGGSCGNYSILELGPTGSPVKILDSPNLVAPTAIAVDGNGTIYVTDVGVFGYGVVYEWAASETGNAAPGSYFFLPYGGIGGFVGIAVY